jgi:hypothetical protein
MLQTARLHQIEGHLLPVWEMMPQAPDDEQPDFPDPEEQPDFPDPEEQPDFDPEKPEK